MCSALWWTMAALESVDQNPPVLTISATLVQATTISGENYPKKFLTDLLSSTPVHQTDLLIPSSDHVTPLLKTQELLCFSLTVKTKFLTIRQHIYPLLSPLRPCWASCSSSDHLTRKAGSYPHICHLLCLEGMNHSSQQCSNVTT